MILSNQAKCLKCGDEPYSAHVHDFKYCECGDMFVDGGMDYIRQGFMNRDSWMDLSIELDELPCEVAMSALEWAAANNRNALGALCAIAIGLRDCGYEITSIADNENNETQLNEAKDILRDFTETKECRETWIEEMRCTIMDYLEEEK